MTEPQAYTDSTTERATEAGRPARRETFLLALGTGAGIITRPEYAATAEPDVRDAGPLAGARAARDLELAARRAAREAVRDAREAGHGWDQIGRALGLTPNADADQAGLTIAEAAYTYAAGSPYTNTAVRHGRAFPWQCASCEHPISDRGLIAGPAADEAGHAADCPRLADAQAQWNADLETELEAGQ